MSVTAASAGSSSSAGNSSETKPANGSAGGVAMNLVNLHNVDAGGSTLFGHLLWEDPHCLWLSAAEKKKIDNSADNLGKNSFRYAFVCDRSREERERGITIDLNEHIWHLPSTGARVRLLDTPGHNDFEKNALAGIAQANVAVLIAAAGPGEFECGVQLPNHQTGSCPGGTHWKLLAAHAMGNVQKVVVAVNKMDDHSVTWSQKRFQEIKDEIEKFMKKNCPRFFGNSKFIPVSTWTGDNLIKRCTVPASSWYTGPTLVEELEDIASKITLPRAESSGLQVSIYQIQTLYEENEKNKNELRTKKKITGSVFLGFVCSGTLKVGDVLNFACSDLTATVESIRIDDGTKRLSEEKGNFNKSVKSAPAGENVSFTCTNFGSDDPKRKEKFIKLKNPPAHVKYGGPSMSNNNSETKKIDNDNNNSNNKNKRQVEPVDTSFTEEEIANVFRYQRREVATAGYSSCAKTFEAEIVTLNVPTSIGPGYECTVAVGTQSVCCKITNVIWRQELNHHNREVFSGLDPMKARKIENKRLALVVLEPTYPQQQEIYVERAAAATTSVANNMFSHILLRDRTFVAAGVVRKVTPRKCWPFRRVVFRIAEFGEKNSKIKEALGEIFNVRFLVCKYLA